MPHGSPVFTGIVRSSYGTHLLDHLAADGTGLAAREVAVVALLQIHADLTGRLHLEAVHGLAGVRVYEVVAPGGHRIASPFLSFEPWLAYILAALPAYMRASFMQILALATYFSGPIKF